MIIEQLIFTVIAFAIFVYMFFRMIKSNDTTYVAILVLEAIGIALNFVEVLFGVKLNIVFVILKYILSLILPILILILEKKNAGLFELIKIQKTKIYLFFGDNKKAKQQLLDILDKNSNSYKAHKMLAELYENEGGIRKSIDEYVQAFDLKKRHHQSSNRVAKLLPGSAI